MSKSMFNRLNKAFYASAFVLLLLSSAANAAGTLVPSNSTLADQTQNLYVVWNLNGMSMGSAIVYPLTVNVGLGATNPNVFTQINRNGALRFASSFDYVNFPSSNIAVIACDPNSNTSNVDPATILDTVAFSRPQAIILFSVTEAHCEINGTFGNTNSDGSTYGSIFTITDRQHATLLSQFISNNNMNSATISASPTASTSPSSSNSNSPNQTGPTTAVAMSILYSITGIITVLFLIIIATGAIRAHRHPERYGPRHGFAGRPRQSRAKGLARAMLETLPIVKFGDDEPPKPATTDIEMEDGARTAAKEVDGSSKKEELGAAKTPAVAKSAAETAPVESGIGPDSQAAASSVHSKDDPAGDTLGCSICTEDFTKGEDVRVLPCNHKYHPACIDPWLLNVSGTCPLCRIDLRPTATNTSAAEGEAELAPPLGDESHAINPRQASIGGGRIDITTLRTVPAAERLAALRALRAERRQQQRDVLAQRGIRDPDAIEEEAREHSRRNRLTMRLKEKFRVRTHRGGSVVATGDDNGEGSSNTVTPAPAAPNNAIREAEAEVEPANGGTPAGPPAANTDSESRRT